MKCIQDWGHLEKDGRRVNPIWRDWKRSVWERTEAAYDNRWFVSVVRSEGGRVSYCLVFFGTSRPVSKVTWNGQKEQLDHHRVRPRTDWGDQSGIWHLVKTDITTFWNTWRILELEWSHIQWWPDGNSNGMDLGNTFLSFNLSHLKCSYTYTLYTAVD